MNQSKTQKKPSKLVWLYAQVIAPLLAIIIVLGPIGVAYWSVSPGGPYRAWFVKEFVIQHAPAQQSLGGDSGSDFDLKKD